MTTAAKKRELIELILAAHVGEATEQQLDQLDSLLRTESWARSQYADLMVLQSQMGWSEIYAHSDGDIESGQPQFLHPSNSQARVTSEKSTQRNATCHAFTSTARWAQKSGRGLVSIARSPVTIAAAALLMFALFSWSQREIKGLRGLLAEREGANAPVAYLAYSNGCDWGNGPLRLHNVGSAVGTGDDITLYEGIAEFRLANGVFVNVEAPASLLINSPTSLVLLYGKVTLHVPWEVTGFRAIAGASHFLARDADFGVIHQGNKIDMHVFSGEVRATCPMISYDEEREDSRPDGSIVTDDTGTFGRALITAGSAISLVNEDHLVKVAKSGLKAEPQLFATKLTMAGGLPSSKLYRDAVLGSKPVGYWRFEKAIDNSIANEVAGGQPLRTEGPLRLAGPPGCRSAEFLPGASYYLISDQPVSDAPADNYSVEVWAKPSYVHRGGIVSLVSSLPEPHATTIEIQGSPKWPGSGAAGYKHPLSVLFVHHNREFAKNQDSGTPCYSDEQYLIRRWQHIVAVKRGSKLQLFLDGNLVGTARDKSPLSPQSRISIGKDTFTHFLNRDFAGQIDEVAFYLRALNAEEVKSHYDKMNESLEQVDHHPASL